MKGKLRDALLAALLAGSLVGSGWERAAGQGETPQATNPIVVAPDGTGDYTEIQPALDAAAENGHTIVVAPGEYEITEPITFSGKAVTVRTAAGPGDAVLRMRAPDTTVVVFERGDTSTLEGFTLTGGALGVYCGDSSPTLSRCAILGNSGSSGGGVYCAGGASPTLTDCTIANNEADRGGGIYCADNSAPTLLACAISSNSANRGGGVYSADNSSPTLTDCTISDNSTNGPANGGGGVYCADDSTAILTGCRILQNAADRGGGVHSRENSTPTLSDCTISDNAAEEGGGVYARESASPTLTRCTISDNSDGVLCEGTSFAIMEGCTVAENSSTGVALRENASPFLINSIVWHNEGAAIDVREGAAPEVHYSCIEAPELWEGEGNINADPLFCAWGAMREVYVDPSALGPGDGTQGSPFSSLARAFAGYSLALSPESPCLGAGERGADMGAHTGPCGISGETRLVHLAPGIYGRGELDLSQHVSLAGAGERETVIEATVRGLRTGARLSRLAVTGGIVVDAGESPEIVSVKISGAGTAGNGGRGVHCAPNSAPALTDCTISENSDRGVYCARGSSPTLTNCTVSGNRAARGFGGGIHCERDSSPTFTGCTISGNSASRGSGLYFGASSAPTLINCIVWANERDSIHLHQESRPDVRYACIEGPEVWEGEGNINADPLFCTAPVDAGFPLFLESPCVGTGQDGADMGADWGTCGLAERLLRGDCNGDGTAQSDVTDVVFLLSYNFTGGAEPPCLAACDADGNGQVTGRVNDAVYLLNFNFLGGPPPVAPFPECGQGNRTGDETLGCEQPPEVCR